MERSEYKLIKMCQKEKFKRKILYSIRKDLVQPNSQLKLLYPFLGNNDVDGKIVHSPLHYIGTFPVIFPYGMN